MTIKGGTSQACAACKYQRRRCSKECPLAPFFPADQAEKFQCAHRLFGVRNIMNTLKQVNPQHRQDAMTSIIFESTMRARFPVHGCLGIINQLKSQIEQGVEELHSVQTDLAICKAQCQQQHILLQCQDDGVLVPIHQHDNTTNTVEPVFSNNEFLTNKINDVSRNDDQDQENFSKQQMNMQDSSSNILEQALQPAFFASQDQYPTQQEVDVSCYDDMPFDTIVGDKQSFIGSKEVQQSKEPCQSSAELPLKNPLKILDRQ